MYILGLTGGMASGKTTVAGFLEDCGAAIVDADKIVHDLQKAETAQTTAIAAKLGQDVLAEDGSLSRAALAQKIQEDKSVLQFLEDILHPAVRAEEKRLLKQAANAGHKVAVLDIPLLFETNAHLLCDSIAICHAPLDVRKQRAFERAGMSDAKWESLLARRWPDAEVLKHADFVIDTSTPVEDTRDQVQQLYDHVANEESGEKAGAWPAKWS